MRHGNQLAAAANGADLSLWDSSGTDQELWCNGAQIRGLTLLLVFNHLSRHSLRKPLHYWFPAQT